MNLDQLIKKVNELRKASVEASRILTLIVNKQNIDPEQIVARNFFGGDNPHVDLSFFLRRNADLLEERAAAELKEINDKIDKIEATVALINLDV